MIQPKDLSRWARGLVAYAEAVKKDGYKGDNVAFLVGYAQSAAQFIVDSTSQTKKCPGPTFQPGDMLEDHEGCCMSERKP